jgi:benzoate membrane transport protein
VPGSAIMRSLGYDVPWRSSIVTAGVATVVGAPAGAHSVNLAAISAALAAGPDAGPDRSRRWLSSQSGAVTYVVLAIASAAHAAIVGVAPDGVIATVAGLALLGTLAASLQGAMASSEGREAPLATFLVAASGIEVLGVGAAAWAIITGLVVHAVLRLVPRERG